MSPSCLANELGENEKKILRAAYMRSLDQEDLSLCEILVTVYGCRPARIGRQWVQNLSPEEMIALCRAESDPAFHFETEMEQEGYQLDKRAARSTVSGLVEKGLLIVVREPVLVWQEDQPRVKGVYYCERIRLTDKGMKFLKRKKPQGNPLCFTR